MVATHGGDPRPYVELGRLYSSACLTPGVTSQAAGQTALAGAALLGRSGQQILVNSANGNLVLQQNDDNLASNGLDLFALRTYNSQGTFNFDGASRKWRWIDGSSRIVEAYNWNEATGKRLALTDPSGNTTAFTYVGSQLTEVRSRLGRETIAGVRGAQPYPTA